MISPAPPPHRPRRRFSFRGVLLVIAMFVLGGLALLGLFMAPRGDAPPPTTAVTR